MVDKSSAPHMLLHLAFDGSGVASFDPVAVGIETAVVPVALIRDGKHVTVVGTAFCISRLTSGEAIFLTARHVIDCVETDSRPAILLLPEADGRSGMRLIGLEYLTFSEQNSDVAIFVVDFRQYPALDRSSTRFSLSLGEPVVGEWCLALGYPQVRGREGQFNCNLAAANGQIEAVHHNKRDRALSTFPSFRTDATYLPAMSGGPILNQAGKVIGIVCTGADVANAQHPLAYGACALAIAELVVTLHDEEGAKHHLPVRELVGRGLIDASPGRVLLTRDADGVTLRWTGDSE